MGIAAKFDHYGGPVWIGVMVLGFIICWQIGLAILALLMLSGRMGVWNHGTGGGRWHYFGPNDERVSSRGWGWRGGTRRHRAHARHSSGNRAFDEYREETLRRLEDEQGEFQGFLERLRQAKDKAEFDTFMDERLRKTVDPDPEDAPENRGPAPNG